LNELYPKASLITKQLLKLYLLNKKEHDIILYGSLIGCNVILPGLYTRWAVAELGGSGLRPEKGAKPEPKNLDYDFFTCQTFFKVFCLFFSVVSQRTLGLTKGGPDGGYCVICRLDLAFVTKEILLSFDQDDHWKSICW
jgi:hypothetical protein